MPYRFWIITLPLFLCTIALLPTISSEQGAAVLRKKLIEYGWDCPYPDFVRQHIREMERRPFDGVIMKLHGGWDIFDKSKWDPAKFAQDFENLHQIHFDKFTDNFIIVGSTPSDGWDWFNESDWEAAEHNLRILARAARIGKCVGLCIDPEPYAANAWAYAETDRERKKSFEEYEAQVRLRGSQFIKAIRKELPKAKILTFFQLSAFWHILRPMQPSERKQALQTHPIALLAAFINGMLDAVEKDVVIIDGNEGSYYHTNQSQYFIDYHLITQRALWMVAPESWLRYQNQMRAGQALYVDFVFALGVWGERSFSRFLSPEERIRWFEHNVYYALYTTDEYVWCYSEQMNWWTNQNIPPGLEETIRSARGKIERGEPLGFDIKDFIESGLKQAEQASH